MEWLNYHHLLYFWTVVKEGSISRACEKLGLAQPTISGQLRRLEENLGAKLLERAGRRLVLTETGEIAFRYADEIFSLGREMQDVLKGRLPGRPLRFAAGVSDALPKLIAYRILHPALSMSTPVRLICHEDTPERLVAELAEHKLDVVLVDSPVTSPARIRVFNHLLGTCGVTLFGAPALVESLTGDFPKRLDGAPFLLPAEGSNLRRQIEEWLDENNIHPRVVGEFKDTALLKTFGQAGAGVFAAPDIIEAEVCKHYGVQVIGRPKSLSERFFAVTAERRLKHPAAAAITQAARSTLFDRRK